ncbi:MAG: hypothetical protein ABSF14_23840 [Terriglobia bacterium]|jgi:hypothetical protein
MNPEDIRQIVREELTTEKPASGKKKREPSQWNKFLKECAPSHKDLPFGDRVKACSIEYHEQKGGSGINNKNKEKLEADSVKQELTSVESSDTE